MISCNRDRFIPQINKVSAWCVIDVFFLLETYCVLRPFAASKTYSPCCVASFSAQKHLSGSSNTSLIALLSMSPRYLFSLVLLGLIVLLSGGFYLWVLRYVCTGGCQPVAVYCESEALAGIVWSQVKWKNKTMTTGDLWYFFLRLHKSKLRLFLKKAKHQVWNSINCESWNTWRLQV